MGRRSKQRALLKANRKNCITFQLPMPIEMAPNIASLIPSDLKDFSCHWAMRFEGGKSSNYMGIVYFNKDFSEGFAIATAKQGSSFGLEFEDMFGLSYQEVITQAAAEVESIIHIFANAKVCAVA